MTFPNEEPAWKQRAVERSTKAAKLRAEKRVQRFLDAAQAIIADKGLSIYAHNIKVIVAGGKVTLEGPVHSDSERRQLLEDVANVVEAETIVNKITVI